jgi:hypothetical protein
MDDKKKTPSLHIYFTKDTHDRLLGYVQGRFGSHRALSMIVQEAVNQYLDRETKTQIK